MSIVERINTLPARQGPPPRMTPTNPQEQLEQFPSDWRIIGRLVEYAFTLSHVVERPTQIAPPGSRALTLNHDDATENRDAAMKKGWVLRHPLAVRNIVSPDVVFVFAPRDEEELGWAKLLLDASHLFARK
jgi:hypothetical protein